MTFPSLPTEHQQSLIFTFPLVYSQVLVLNFDFIRFKGLLSGSLIEILVQLFPFCNTAF